MSERAFVQVDVFTAKALYGNPVAVVMDAEGMSSETMQDFARWTNLSETTFVTPVDRSSSEADYRVRIFTPDRELPFAGHPSVGTAHAMLESGRVEPRNGRLVQACGAGLVELKIERENPSERARIFVRVPTPKFHELERGDVAGLEVDTIVSGIRSGSFP